MAEFVSVTYTGTVAVDQETLGLHWEPGETQDLHPDVAARLTGPGSDFMGPPAPAPAASAASPSSVPPPPDQTPAPPPAVGG